MKVELDDGVDAWEFSSNQRVKDIVQNTESHMKKLDQKLPSRDENPLHTENRHGLDSLPDLEHQEATQYYPLADVLRQMVGLGRFDF